MEKITILEGDWTNDLYRELLLPEIVKAGIPIQKQTTLPITHIYDREYWGGLQATHRFHLAVLDYRHWVCDDRSFFDYVSKISNIKFPIVGFSESPFSFERPYGVDPSLFEKKIFERSKIFSNQMRSKRPKTILLSPAIRSISSPEDQLIYLDYFVSNHSLFDAYALHCCGQMNEHQLAALVSFLRQILEISFKPVYITKWAIASCDHEIESSRMLQPAGWDRMTTKGAIRVLHKTYNTINEVCSDNNYWFFTGACQDIYHPSTDAPVSHWGTNSFYCEDVSTPNWMSHHFAGLIDFNGNVKERMFHEFLNMSL